MASEIEINEGRIKSILPLSRLGTSVVGDNPSSLIASATEVFCDQSLPYAIPGFIDSHIHIESSMLVPSEFARIASIHGTVATVSDPHEIANVLGVSGVEFMVENGKRVPLKFCFGAPSCVPATAFETSGAVVDSLAIRQLLQRHDIGYLAEMMNYPGVLYHDDEVHAKLEAAKECGKPIDGHAPGLTGAQAAAYANAGISTDHECTSLAEALHKIACGMKILIREGSAAKNFEALKSLVSTHPGEVMFCSDDKHPDSLALNHIDQLVRRSIASGADLFDVLRVACINPIEHYRLPVGQLRVGDPADFIVVDDLSAFNVRQVYIDGELVAENGVTNIDPIPIEVINHFECSQKSPSDFEIRCSLPNSLVTVNVIEAIDGSLLTEKQTALLPVRDGRVLASPPNDVLKIAIVNRYRPALPSVAFVRGFGLWLGAIASSVGHDCHNILAVGADDESLCMAVNQVIECRGGIAATDGRKTKCLPLPIAGIMSDRDGHWVANQYQMIDQFTKQILGSPLAAPFMTLSFMGLLVIPRLKLSDMGLFDGEAFEFVPVIRM